MTGHFGGTFTIVPPRLVEAESLLRETIDLWRNEKTENAHLGVAWAQTLLGRLLARAEKYEQAEEALREALATRRSFLARDHPLLADTLLALTMSRQGGRPDRRRRGRLQWSACALRGGHRNRREGIRVRARVSSLHTKELHPLSCAPGALQRG